MRYRYITCGLVSPNEPVSHFRLIASRNLDKAGSAIRIALPDDTPLCKYSCDPYSTCEDNSLLIKDCQPILMVRINGRLRHMPGIWPEHQPHEVYQEMIRGGWQYSLQEKTYLRR